MKIFDYQAFQSCMPGMQKIYLEAKKQIEEGQAKLKKPRVNLQAERDKYKKALEKIADPRLKDCDHTLIASKALKGESCE